MKKYFFFIILCFNVLSCYGQNSRFTLEGEFLVNPVKKVYIAYPGARDSALITNSRFSISGHINHPVLAFISSDPSFKSGNNISEFFLEANTVILKIGDGNNLNLHFVSGSKTEEQKKIFDRNKDLINAHRSLLVEKIYVQEQQLKEYQGGSEKLNEIQTRIDSLNQLIKDLAVELKRKQIRFFDEYPTSYVTLYQLSNYRIVSQDSLQLYFDRMTSMMKNSVYGQELQKKLAVDKIVIGSVAHDFKTVDVNGKELSLSDYKNKKYVLLDFWASWCIPCRDNHPELLKLYTKYKDKGLEIIGIADDVGRENAWRLAIAQDKIGSWEHILRGTARDAKKGLIKDDITRLYNVHEYPTRILIDKEGKIISIINWENRGKLSSILATILW